MWRTRERETLRAKQTNNFKLPTHTRSKLYVCAWLTCRHVPKEQILPHLTTPRKRRQGDPHTKQQIKHAKKNQKKKRRTAAATMHFGHFSFHFACFVCSTCWQQQFAASAMQLALNSSNAALQQGVCVIQCPPNKATRPTPHAPRPTRPSYFSGFSFLVFSQFSRRFYLFLSDLFVGRCRVQRTVQLRRIANAHLSRPLRAIRPLSHRPRVLQSRLAGLSGVPRALPLLFGTFHLHEAAARGLHSARLVTRPIMPSPGYQFRRSTAPLLLSPFDASSLPLCLHIL